MAGLSAEEERLWSIVTTNSLDFDAWTALIDETERMSEVCLMDSNLVCIGLLHFLVFIFSNGTNLELKLCYNAC